MKDYPKTLPRARDGWRLSYAPTNTTPCVLHFNGFSKGGQNGQPPMKQFIPQSVSSRAWVPSQNVPEGECCRGAT